MSYRDTILPCPGCGDALAPKQVGESVIDVCPDCGGIWVDWFDGEISAIVRATPRVPFAGAAERAGSPACPRDKRPLDAEHYLEREAEILRCGDCSGAFVPRDSAPAVAAVDPERKGSSPSGDGWSRLSTVIERWFGWEETEQK